MTLAIRSAMLLLLLCSVCRLHAASPEHPNVLFIAVDDLRPQLACYGKPEMHSPNIDRLAASGVLFERAYCMVPTCGASRAALMTSQRPNRTQFVNHLTWAEREVPDALPLHTHFKQNGYETISLGKIFHHPTDHADGWSEPAWRSPKRGYQDRASERQAVQQNKQQWPGKSNHRGPAFEAFDGPEENYPDADCASRAIEYLEKYAEHPEQPFFLAVGFLKPHLPFNAPQKYWDLYDHDSIDLPPNYFPPQGAPQGAVHNSGELRAYAGIQPRGPVERETARNLIHGYYACVSFADAQIGRVVDSLARLKLADHTIVVLWGDHGWQLGEHGMWNKHSCFETSMQAPLLISAPGDTLVQPQTRVQSMAEFIDVYPTLCDLAAIPHPPGLEGTSLLPVMRDPSLPGKQFAVGRFGAGDTIRSDKWRYSEYTSPRGDSTGVMLYDQVADAEENSNVAAVQMDEVHQLSQQLRQRMGKSPKRSDPPQ
ncbi:sulfatase [Aureliella helgolandensis]|uniref:Arylsulfatase n=1 Tax=Aureliella helgolandensis TaxID=2527968 RepID=A0A518GE40_9BACT|nr:sulfatase [Aureliella helgolandensis]QDV26866.1 Arylsulfatase [Aureliella helgolandensis]